MKSVTTERFRKAMNKLPADVQQRARQAYNLWKQNNNHPGLHFKQVHDREPIYQYESGFPTELLVLKKMTQ